MTTTSTSIVTQALKNDGYIEDMSYPYIYSYKGNDNKQLFALFTEGQFIDIYQSTENAVCLISMGMLTEEGEKFLQKE